MNVAITCRNLRGKTGVSAIVLEHIRQLSGQGHEIDLYGDKLDKTLISAAGGNPIRLQRLPLGRYAARRFFSYRFDQINKHKRYDLIISNGELLHQNVNFSHNLTELESEVVPSPVSSGMRAKIRFDQQLFSTDDFNICIANSGLMKTELTNRHGTDPDKIHVVYPGYNPSTFSTKNHDDIRSRKRLELCGTDEFLIGFITSGHFTKRGADIMLETLAGLDNSLLNKTKVLAIGSNDNLSSLQQQFNDAGLGQMLIKRDKTNNLAPYYHSIDLLFHPARIEEFGLVVAEAAACGTAVLSSKRTGATEIFTSAGIKTPGIPNPVIFTKYLMRLITDPDHRSMTADKQSAVIEKHTWSDYFDRLSCLYKQNKLIT
jgi:UDP-glucose:(heptosyl)LPS alpha-1,3-glucosyltransferase